MNVTFDSNVWRPLVSPTVFPNDPDANHLEIIRQGIAKKSVSGFLVETIFTLEAIRRKDRKGFFGVYKGAIKTTTEVHNAGTIAARFSIGPSATHHANNNPYLEKHLNDALLLDFKLLRIPRIGGVQNPDLKPDYYAPDSRFTTQDRQARCAQVSTEIEAKGCGIAHVKTIGKRHANGKPWLEGIKVAPETEDGAIAKAIAEWGDGDAVAAHYGYGNDFFCTRDKAKAAGADSVLSAPNQNWLNQDFKVVFVTPEALANIVKNQ